MKDKNKLFEVPEISSIQDMILKSVGKYPHKTALEDIAGTPISKLTYQQLLDNVLRFGNSLKALGLNERTNIAAGKTNNETITLPLSAFEFFDKVTYRLAVTPGE